MKTEILSLDTVISNSANIVSRFTARAKADGRVTKETATTKADTKTGTPGHVKVATTMQVSGCSPAEKLAHDIVKTALKLDSLTGGKLAAIIASARVSDEGAQSADSDKGRKNGRNGKAADLALAK